MRCVNILSRLWHAPDAAQATGCSTTGQAKRRCSAVWRSSAAGSTDARAAGQVGRQAEPGDGYQRPGLLGEVRQLLGRRDAAGADGGRPLPPLRRGGGQTLRREHDRCRRDPRLDVRRLLRAGRGDLRGARRLRAATRASTCRSTSTARRARSSHRSSTRTWSGTSGCRGSPRSTPPATSTAWCIPGSAGSCGATLPRCPRI